ncbi:GNAT family N-acetyltransferase [Oceanotoga sp. DSM 15011]|jgi:RimJ/RimL family protein N-acetyltransferase|uniref:RimJ/RimL family protein N-acetyltransferase n=1 Tax=Oceanotoga teriensis TaxID=515440 RepID=A0AA45HJQ2_9BACT|nr:MULTISPECIES: GNAT family protein [Oceanotoga]MDN5343439.1 hypothetical protein [Oceanotoga sp.]PWJ96494.1 RimJ/RimL family protein N-acetyltransferase [Oceanotoga teriensis]UYP00332.1 GNAT family N-acetyltransferase [Oceanotoga sp. DSM 15011]
MISISNSKVILRDFIESDIEKRISWETKHTEWKLWDAPWEFDNITQEQKQKKLDKYIEKMYALVEKYKIMSDTKKRLSFQICNKNNKYIGWCNSYRIDNEFLYSSEGTKCAIGIDIPDISYRGKGYAFHSLCLFIDYLMEHGESEIYTQTWSGNIRMINLAKKLGFEECSRKENSRNVRGKKYDGLTFLLNKVLYKKSKQEL